MAARVRSRCCAHRFPPSECSRGGAVSDVMSAADRYRSPGSPDAALATEYLVIRENTEALVVTEGRNDEASAEHADGQPRIWWTLPFRQQLLESLGLAGIVAQNDRRQSVGDDFAQPLHVAKNRLRRPEREMNGRRLLHVTRVRSTD